MSMTINKDHYINLHKLYQVAAD